MLRRMSVRIKLLGSFLISIVLFCAAVASALYFITSIERLNEEQLQRDRDVRTALLLKNEIGVMYGIQSDVIINENSTAASQFVDRIEGFKRMVEETAALFDDPAEQEELISAGNWYVASFGRLLELHNFRSFMKAEDLMREFQAADSKSDEYKDVIFAKVDALIERKDAEFRQVQEEMRSQISSAFVISVSATVVAVLLAIGLSLFTGFKVANPLLALTASARRVAAGDLTGEIPKVNAQDEIGQLSQSFHDMVMSLKNLIGKVNETAEEVAALSEELAASAEESARGSQAAAAAIQQVAAGAETQERSFAASSAAIGEMAAGVHQISRSSGEVLEASQMAAEKATDGRDSIREVIAQMAVIRTSVDEQVSAVTRLESKSKEISDMANEISKIAKQTNLLALNAAIEASRAGEHGKGFAVVAGEVRKLAEQSRESAERIAEILGGIQEDIRATVQSILHGSQEVQTGMETAEKTGEAFQAIHQAVEEVASKIRDMSALAQQMSAQSEAVASAVEEMTGIARETAKHAQDMSATSQEQMAIVEQISASAAHLSGRANALQEMIGSFKV